MKGKFRRKETKKQAQKNNLCNLCSRRFVIFEGLLDHVKSIHAGICTECVIVFPTKREFEHHLKIHAIPMKKKKKSNKSKKSRKNSSGGK